MTLAGGTQPFSLPALQQLLRGLGCPLPEDGATEAALNVALLRGERLVRRFCSLPSADWPPEVQEAAAEMAAACFLRARLALAADSLLAADSGGGEAEENGGAEDAATAENAGAAEDIATADNSGEADNGAAGSGLWPDSQGLVLQSLRLGDVALGFATAGSSSSGNSGGGGLASVSWLARAAALADELYNGALAALCAWRGVSW